MTREKNMRKILLTGASFAFLVGFFQTNDAHSEGKREVTLACYVNGQVKIIPGSVSVTLCYGSTFMPPTEDEYCSDGSTAKDALAACQKAFGSGAVATIPSNLNCHTYIPYYNQSTWKKYLCMSNIPS
jgi:hypothetical protein